jgi:hypothetical protein
VLFCDCVDDMYRLPVAPRKDIKYSVNTNLGGRQVNSNNKPFLRSSIAEIPSTLGPRIIVHRHILRLRERIRIKEEFRLVDVADQICRAIEHGMRPRPVVMGPVHEAVALSAGDAEAGVRG